MKIKSLAVAAACVMGVLAVQPALAQSADKKALIQKLVQLQQPGIDAMSRGLVQGPASQLLDEAAGYIQTQVPPAQQQAMAKGVDDDVKKYMDDALPMVRSSATKLAPSVLGPIFEKNFTVEELQQAIQILESPVQKKLQQISPELQQALVDAVVKSTDAQIQPKIANLNTSLRKRLNIPANSPAVAAPKK
ncbi:hypothetical protein [Amphibiibacter pelophylacis]|uniref:Uncharacterized protein n=1 Tax=Amphibiibacter pelophylacis TaxID=1799477 RepID=A0ACC6P3J3_9BURK